MSDHARPNDDANRIVVDHDGRRGVCVVRLEGEHDIATAPELRAALGEVPPGEKLIVDLSACRFIDSSVIALLLSARRDRSVFGVVVPDGEDSVIGRALRITGVTEVLHVEASIARALLASGSPGGDGAVTPVS